MPEAPTRTPTKTEPDTRPMRRYAPSRVCPDQKEITTKKIKEV